MIAVSRREVLFGVSAVCILTAAPSLAREGRVALNGYDPVSYFTEGRPEKGLPEFSAIFDEVTYNFKSASHRDLFAANPDKYAPQFQGFCTIDLSRGILTEADPQAWTIKDGKLYVFGKPRGPGLFADEGPMFVAKATENWSKIRRSPPSQ